MADDAPPGPTSTAMPRVRVAVLTYQRPHDLAAILPTLLEQVREASVDASIIVVDNDPDGSAVDVVADRGAEPELVYVHEPTPGIAAARNRALDESADHDALVFIDDDERPAPGWLDRLVSLWEQTGAAAVVGPVVSALPASIDPWILAGGYFERRRPATGTLVDVAATNNILLDLAFVRRLGLRFDPDFGISGGSDSLFTMELHRGGGRLVWCAEAVVTDVVPAQRATRSWVLRRALRLGNGRSRVELALARGPIDRARLRLGLTAKGLVRAVGGSGRFVAGVVLRSMAHRARGARTLARGIGFVSGAWGYTYAEYRRAPRR